MSLISSKKYPPLLDIASKTGKANALTSIDLSSLTKGVFNLATLLESNHLECFLFQTALALLDASGTASYENPAIL